MGVVMSTGGGVCVLCGGLAWGGAGRRGGRGASACPLWAWRTPSRALHCAAHPSPPPRSAPARAHTLRTHPHACNAPRSPHLPIARWDEDTFGLEYDLDLFNIVAVDDFNMGGCVCGCGGWVGGCVCGRGGWAGGRVGGWVGGWAGGLSPTRLLPLPTLPPHTGAMENKSLNIFNSRLVLATPESATDGDFARIEGECGGQGSEGGRVGVRAGGRAGPLAPPPAPTGPPPHPTPTPTPPTHATHPHPLCARRGGARVFSQLDRQPRDLP